MQRQTERETDRQRLRERERGFFTIVVISPCFFSCCMALPPCPRTCTHPPVTLVTEQCFRECFSNFPCQKVKIKPTNNPKAQRSADSWHLPAQTVHTLYFYAHVTLRVD